MTIGSLRITFFPGYLLFSLLLLVLFLLLLSLVVVVLVVGVLLVLRTCAGCVCDCGSLSML